MILICMSENYCFQTGYSLLLYCQQSLFMIVPPALVLAILVWAFLRMDDKITALQKRVDELEATQKNHSPNP